MLLSTSKEVQLAKKKKKVHLWRLIIWYGPWHLVFFFPYSIICECFCLCVLLFVLKGRQRKLNDNFRTIGSSLFSFFIYIFSSVKIRVNPVLTRPDPFARSNCESPHKSTASHLATNPYPPQIKPYQSQPKTHPVTHRDPLHKTHQLQWQHLNPSPATIKFHLENPNSKFSTTKNH